MKDNFDLFFGKPKKLNFLSKKFDFELDPYHFMKWLSIETEEKLTGNYIYDCSSMCEYSCLYSAMMLYDKNLKGELKIYYGRFGGWEHYWLGYKINEIEYFIDLTLKQFIKDAPMLAITLSENNEVPGGYSYLSDGYTIDEYIQEKRAFDFYTNPKTFEPPKININDILHPNTFDLDDLKKLGETSNGIKI